MKPKYEEVISAIGGVEAAYIDFNGIAPPALRIRGKHSVTGTTEVYLGVDELAALYLVLERVREYAERVARGNK